MLSQHWLYSHHVLICACYTKVVLQSFMWIDQPMVRLDLHRSLESCYHKQFTDGVERFLQPTTTNGPSIPIMTKTENGRYRCPGLFIVVQRKSNRVLCYLVRPE